ncbi:MAG: DUF3099 domain-containing protein [Streptomycetaceae bacterium]|nr:DUF3099 domain-containing protein [Streptomycetaceae bacterium]
MRKHGGTEVFRITSARSGLSEDVRGRQRRYVISMSVRTVCFLLAIALWHVQIVLAAIALVLGGVLPYIAVVIANAGRANATDLPSAVVPPPARPMLDRAPDAADTTQQEQQSTVRPGTEHTEEPKRDGVN